MNPRAVVAGIAVGVVAASAGFAAAHGDSGSSEPGGGNASSLAGPAISYTDDSGERIVAPSQSEEAAVEAGLIPAEGEQDEVDFMIEGPPADWMVETCRSSVPPTTPLHCDAIIAIAEGRLEPGTYSDDELRAAVAE